MMIKKTFLKKKIVAIRILININKSDWLKLFKSIIELRYVK